MKQIVTVTEVENEGLEGLMGQVITVFAVNYIYTGKLVGMNDTFIKLEHAGIVYETGPFQDKEWKDMQALPHPVYIKTAAIESFMILK
jgi:hypothetical protein